MNWKSMWILWRKEMTGALRDRKTIVALIVMTLLYYPILTLGIGWFTKLQTENLNAQIPAVAVLDAHQSGQTEEMLEFTALLRESGQFKIAAPANAEQALENRTIQGIASVEKNNGSFANWIVQYEYDPRYQLSKHSLDQMKALTEQLSRQTVRARLQAKGLDFSMLTPFEVIEKEAPGTHSDAAAILSFVPYLLAIGLVAGGLGLAMDITAGEKERGTIATLLVSQLSRTEIAVGKIMTTLTFSIFSIGLTILSLLLSLKLSSLFFDARASFLSIGLNDIFDLTVILLPLAFLITTLLVLVGTYARSPKEGSMYAMPVMLLVVFAGGAGGNIDMTVNHGIYWIPILGPFTAVKSLLLHVPHAWEAAGLATATTLLYAGLAISVVVRIYSKEEVLFRT